jgi:hypothetical protein
MITENLNVCFFIIIVVILDVACARPVFSFERPSITNAIICLKDSRYMYAFQPNATNPKNDHVYPINTRLPSFLYPHYNLLRPLTPPPHLPLHLPHPLLSR